MARISKEFFMGYIAEVQSYIPVLKLGIGELKLDAGQQDALNEVYRLVHIIKGASAMVGVHAVNQIAGRMESVLERAQAGRIRLSGDMLATMESAVERIDLLCGTMASGTTGDEQTLATLTVDEFDRIDSANGPDIPADDLASMFAEDDLLLAGFEGVETEGEQGQDFAAEAMRHFEKLHGIMQTLTLTVTGRARASDARVLLADGSDCLRQVRERAEAEKLSEVAAICQLVEELFDGLAASAQGLDSELHDLLTEAIDLLATLIYVPASFDEQRAEEVFTRLHARMEEVAAHSRETTEASSIAQDRRRQGAAAAIPAKQSSTPDETGPRGSIRSNLFSDEERLLLRQGFQEEAEEHLQSLHEAMQRLEKVIAGETALTTAHREDIRGIRRAVHTIKGASAVIGLGEISGYAHGVEDFLDWLYEGARVIDPAMVNRLAEALDLLGLLVEAPDTVSADSQVETLARLSASTEAPGASSERKAPSGEKLSAATPLEEPAEVAEAPEEEVQAVVAETAKTIRINQPQLDTLINLSNELLVGISGFDRNMGSFKNVLGELELTVVKLRSIAQELETKFEVKALDSLSDHFSNLDNTLSQIRTSQSFAEFDALELDRYTQLNLIIRSLNEATVDTAAIQTSLGSIYAGISGDISRQYRVVRELQLQMLRTRMSPMATLTARLSRTMRDVALRLGKRVRLVVEGDRVELDRVVWEKLADPMMHLIRNAVHHGIETEAERVAAGKSAIATITTDGRREGNSIVIRFSDDGRGLDFAAIRHKAMQMGLGQQTERMNEQQLTELIFYPGFSTKTVSDISGRGVGMDVVRENVRGLQGAINVESRPGEGATFVIRVPLTLGVMRALLVTAGEVTYGIVLNDIRDIHRTESSAIVRKEGLIRLNNETLPWYSLPVLLGQEDETVNLPRALVLVLATEGRAIAVSIPEITGQKEIVIKALGPHLRTVQGVSGAAVMGDGSVIPVLDIPGLIQAASGIKQVEEPVEIPAEVHAALTVMIVDDSISIRRVMSRLVTGNGWEAIEAKDGLDAIEQMEEVIPDCIVLDIEMPRMNGFEFLARLANLSGRSHIPVIMLTSRTSAKHQAKAFGLGAKAFLNKPCRDEEFMATVLQVTGDQLSPFGNTANEVAR